VRTAADPGSRGGDAPVKYVGSTRPWRSRFFSATIIAGRLHVLGLASGGPWDPTRLEWRTEADVHTLMNPRAGDRKVLRPGDLEGLLAAPPEVRPSRFLWIREDLLEEARRLWKRDVPQDKRSRIIRAALHERDLSGDGIDRN
jgi:hypothetical protein